MTRKCADCGMNLSVRFVKEYGIPIYGFSNGEYVCNTCYEDRVM